MKKSSCPPTLSTSSSRLEAAEPDQTTGPFPAPMYAGMMMNTHDANTYCSPHTHRPQSQKLVPDVQPTLCGASSGSRSTQRIPSNVAGPPMCTTVITGVHGGNGGNATTASNAQLRPGGTPAGGSVSGPMINGDIGGLQSSHCNQRPYSYLMPGMMNGAGCLAGASSHSIHMMCGFAPPYVGLENGYPAVLPPTLSIRSEGNRSGYVMDGSASVYYGSKTSSSTSSNSWTGGGCGDVPPPVPPPNASCSVMNMASQHGLYRTDGCAPGSMRGGSSMSNNSMRLMPGPPMFLQLQNIYVPPNAAGGPHTGSSGQTTACNGIGSRDAARGPNAPWHIPTSYASNDYQGPDSRRQLSAALQSQSQGYRDAEIHHGDMLRQSGLTNPPWLPEISSSSRMSRSPPMQKQPTMERCTSRKSMTSVGPIFSSKEDVEHGCKQPERRMSSSSSGFPHLRPQRSTRSLTKKRGPSQNPSEDYTDSGTATSPLHKSILKRIASQCSRIGRRAVGRRSTRRRSDYRNKARHRYSDNPTSPSASSIAPSDASSVSSSLVVGDEGNGDADAQFLRGSDYSNESNSDGVRDLRNATSTVCGTNSGHVPIAKRRRVWVAPLDAHVIHLAIQQRRG
ncbi:hypothetical protein ABL78_3407 [Leptomonas seymouri]|uniref:Uncharacterized protein n=1 Tax=Leptomonas seymouri TaxID=5684 RepID=A0A0N0P6D1_LEPSE|nr:hypothetical protein ABL78_3407 [Leptomonas seymouri]|eukprot:KPI87496.1 hypothetical protein ABL78_3407 [Leptomonas seymouri]